MRIGAAVEAGGNQVFFANGVLSTLAQSGIAIDTLVGLSSSMPVILAYLIQDNDWVCELFADKLDANRHNFYMFKRPHFPHTAIYESAISELVERYASKTVHGDFIFLGTQTSKRFGRTKALIGSLVLFMRHAAGIDLIDLYRFAFGISDITLRRADVSRPKELITFILGSSTIYPFIELQSLEGKLLLEGALRRTETSSLLDSCDKRIIIHTDPGFTGIVDRVFHIAPSQKVLGAMLDYTTGDAVRAAHQLGKSDARSILTDLGQFLSPIPDLRGQNKVRL